jgi:hypothetical protein
LCDLDGNLVNIRNEAFKYSYANILLKSRQIYILAEIESPIPLIVKPLLNNSDLLTEEFYHNLIPGVVKKQRPMAKRISMSDNSSSVSKSRSIEKKASKRTKAN